MDTSIIILVIILAVFIFGIVLVIYIINKKIETPIKPVTPKKSNTPKITFI